MKRVPAYKQRRRMRERAAFVAAVQARTHRPAALGAGCSASVGTVAIHSLTVAPECGGSSPCDIGGAGGQCVAVVSVGRYVGQRTDGAA